MPQEQGRTPSFLNRQGKAKHVCEFCGRDDFNSRQALSYHRLNTCDKRPQGSPPPPPDPPVDDPATQARKLSDMMIPADPSPAKEPLVGGIPTDPLAGPPKPPPAPAADDQEEPAEELHVPRIPVVLLVFILIAIAALALIIMFWDVIEREGKKFLKRFDPPAPGVTGDGGQQQLIE